MDRLLSPRPLATLIVVLVLVACAPASTPPAPPAGAPLATADAAAPPALIPVIVGRAGVRVTAAPLWLAQDLGFFAKHGVAVEDSLLRNTAAVEAALYSNEAQIGFTGLASVLTARASGGDTILTASYMDVALGELMVRPEIRQPADLRGKRFGVQSFGGTIHIRGLLALERLGLDPERDDIQVIVAGDDPTLAQSLVAGVVDGVPISYTSSRVARAAGMHGWDFGELGVPESGLSVLVTESLARERPELVERFIKGLAEGVHYLKQSRSDPARRERALALTAARLQAEPDAVATELDKVAEFASSDMRPDMANLAAFRTAIVRQTPAAEQVSMEDAVDLRFVRKLEGEGFFAQLRASP